MSGKLLIYFGVLCIVIGLIVMYGGKVNWPKLPGDFIIRKENFTFYFPLASSILLSILVTLIIYLIQKLK